jgi:hypothetical protein
MPNQASGADGVKIAVLRKGPQELRYLLILQGFAFLVMFFVFAFMEVLS